MKKSVAYVIEVTSTLNPDLFVQLIAITELNGKSTEINTDTTIDISFCSILPNPLKSHFVLAADFIS